MPSPQTLSDDRRRVVAAWAADCASRVLPLFEAEAPDDGRARDAIERARGYARGELDAAGQIRVRLVAGRAAASATSPAGAAAARAAAQASGVAHMGAHALGAAAYAAKAVGLAAPGDPHAVDDEIRWQLAAADQRVREALRLLPPLGTDRSGPLGTGLLTAGVLGSAIRTLQERLAEQR
ncbi:putative immunity protein [Cnuibacter sp. UC19_7]|uniref:putative immunity protein n=1 Tax=Cnuibacter sp. UC19_7 TaxID=3350166 RepID=UPI00366E769E